MTQRELYPIEEARELLGGISRNTIYRIMRTGELKSVQIGRRRLIPASAITAFINSATTSEPQSLLATQCRALARSLEPIDPPPPVTKPGRRDGD
jgi:excisionase family DNA binding protein